jgi:hypothetical protein
VKRFPILLIALLALVVSACSSEPADASDVTTEPTATVEPTPEPTQPPPSEATESGGSLPSGPIGSDTALLELLPDELNGASRTDINLADNPMFAQALAGSGIDATDVEYIISTWGTGDDTVSATAMRIPGIERPALEQMARLMTGAAEGEGTAEVATIGGKEVIVINATDVDQAAYMYFVGDGVFIIGGPSAELAEELLSQLP